MSGESNQSVQRLWDSMNSCTLCPRKCKVNRKKGETGFCGIGDVPLVSSAGPHFGEESVLVGAIEQLAQSMLELQYYGCCNINFVTPTHVATAIVAALELAREEGLTLPTVYNTGGYDSVETLKLLEGFMDIYMPDMKYADPKVAGELSAAPDYPQINREALKEMHRQVGDLKTERGLATRGLLVRHLVLPENLAGSFEIIDFLADQISPKTTINVMDQYRPCYKANLHPAINRRPTTEEVQSVRRYAIQKGLNVLD